MTSSGRTFVKSLSDRGSCPHAARGVDVARRNVTAGLSVRLAHESVHRPRRATFTVQCVVTLWAALPDVGRPGFYTALPAARAVRNTNHM